MLPEEKKYRKYSGGSDREMLREREWEPQAYDGSGDYSYKDNYDAA